MGEPDILIVGAGTAGIPCAIAGAENGARDVVVLEKTAELGGTLHLSAGQMSGAGTRIQKAQGIEDSPQEHYVRTSCGSVNGFADPALVRQAVDEAAATLDWLQDLGFPFPMTCRSSTTATIPTRVLAQCGPPRWVLRF